MVCQRQSASETQVLVVGAGPVGLTLALALGRRGVRCVLIERNETSIQLPRMERCNARTMEIAGTPLDVRDVPDAAARDLYERDLVLVRPDLDVVWRGNRAPDDPQRVAALATGRLSRT